MCIRDSLILGCIAATAHLWAWGRHVNADEVEHTFLGFPVEAFAIAPFIATFALTFYALFSSTQVRLADRFEQVCKSHIYDLTFPQCECVGEQLSIELNTADAVRFTTMATGRSRIPLLDRVSSDPYFSQQSGHADSLIRQINSAIDICQASD